ncbi:glycoside hydrolase family 27 protein [Bacteroides cellulosilyticus]|uniref:glycoside hydrolase family 27 protein n=1 Tax=Bacteroides cellulosilyticus TaxID=246787 RepID=UPI0032BFC530
MKQVCNSELAPTPPMGWNSWDCFGLDVTEEEVKRNADYMARELKDLGWQYVVVDLGWYAPGVTTANYKQRNIPMLTDEYGRLIPVPERFPSSTGGKGFAPLAEYVHSLGLKFGIHIMRGMPWTAAEENKPIKGNAACCGDIADKSDQCLWFGSMYGIDCTKEGAQAYYDSLIELYTQWGVDFIKADDMGTWDGDGLNSPLRTDELEALATSIAKFGNRIVLSVSPGAAYVGNAYHLSRHAHAWRISCDFWDDWTALKRQFPRCAAWAKRHINGHWPDADMLPLGRIGIRGEVGSARNTNFTPDEQITLMSLWCIFRSPLMFGGDLPQTDDFTRQLITNRQAIRLNQDSKNNRQVSADGDIIVWGAESTDDQTAYRAVFNLSDTATLRACPEIPGFYGRKVDIWTHEPVEEEITIPAHGCRLIAYN